MSTVEPYGDGPNYKPLIIIAVVVIAILFLLALKANAFERDEKPFTAVGSQYKVVKDPIVTVERYEPQDYHNDETILIAGERYKPIVWVAEPRQITVEEKAQFLPKEDNEVKITATIESDEFDPVNYPL